MGSIKGQKHNPYIRGKYAHVNPNDVVFTPDELAKAICQMFPLSGRIWEPCKGEGAFLKYLPPETEWSEITEGKNLYDFHAPVDWVITNPPYSDFNRFLTHIFSLAQNVVLLVPVAKMFKSMGTIKQILSYGGIVSIDWLPASKAGFPFGFPVGIFWIKKGYAGETRIKEYTATPKSQTVIEGFTSPSGDPSGNITRGYGAGDASANCPDNFPYPQDVMPNSGHGHDGGVLDE